MTSEHFASSSRVVNLIRSTMALALFRTESDQRINCPIRTNTQRFCLARAVHYQPAPHHPGTRQEPAKMVHEAVANADPTKPTKDPVPYVGIQYVAISEFQGLGTQVGQQIAAALAGQVTVDQALQTAQRSAERTMRQAGYPKK